MNSSSSLVLDEQTSSTMGPSSPSKDPLKVPSFTGTNDVGATQGSSLKDDQPKPFDIQSISAPSSALSSNNPPQSAPPTTKSATTITLPHPNKAIPGVLAQQQHGSSSAQPSPIISPGNGTASAPTSVYIANQPTTSSAGGPNVTGIATNQPSINQPRPPSGMVHPQLNDALAYLDRVKAEFHDQPDVYNKFLQIMRDFKVNMYKNFHFPFIEN